jgi:hypothetical protein
MPSIARMPQDQADGFRDHLVALGLVPDAMVAHHRLMEIQG